MKTDPLQLILRLLLQIISSSRLPFHPMVSPQRLSWVSRPPPALTSKQLPCNIGDSFQGGGGNPKNTGRLAATSGPSAPWRSPWWCGWRWGARPTPPPPATLGSTDHCVCGRFQRHCLPAIQKKMRLAKCLLHNWLNFHCLAHSFLKCFRSLLWIFFCSLVLWQC